MNLYAQETSRRFAPRAWSLAALSAILLFSAAPDADLETQVALFVECADQGTTPPEAPGHMELRPIEPAGLLLAQRP